MQLLEYIQNVMSYEFIVVLASAIIANQISKLTQNKRIRAVLFFGVYFASVVFGILCFAIWQTISRHSNFFHVFIGYLFYFITKYLISIVIVPLITELIDLDRVNTGIRWVVILFSVLVLIIAPYIFPVRNYDKNVSKLELGGMVFTKKFYDINNFRKYAENGYGTEANGQMDTPDDYSDEEEPTKEIEDMDFTEAVDAMLYYYHTQDYELSEDCMNRAYGLYNNGRDNGDSFYIGLMFWYKGDYEDDGESFYRAGEIFEEIGESYNAAVSYKPAYKYGYCNSSYALEQYLECIRQDVHVEDSIDSYMYFYNQEGPEMPFFNDYIDLLPDNLRVQMVGVTSHIENMGDDDLALIDRFISTEAYNNCPKLILVKTYYDMTNESWFSLDKIDRLFSKHEEFFDPEDKINYAWMLYLEGKKEKALDVLNRIYDGKDSHIEKTLLKSVLLLEGTDGIPADDAKYYYYELLYDTDFSTRYDNESVLKYNIVKAYLANKIGFKTDSDEINQAFVSGDYQNCVSLCDDMISHGHSSKNILMLKADALLHLIEDAPEEEKEELFQKAEETVLELKGTVSVDYVDTMKLLRDLYRQMPDRETEFVEADEILRVVVK